MSKGQSGRQDNRGSYSKENAMPAKSQPYASRGQSGKQDSKGAFSREVGVAPVEKHSSRIFAGDQDWAGPYTTNKVDTGKAYDIPHDAAGNPKR